MNKNMKTGLRGGKQRGIALIMALIIILVVSLVIASTLYVITHSTSMSGAGKRYETASQAADGAVEVMKDSISLLIGGAPESSLNFLTKTSSANLSTAAMNSGVIYTATLTLPGTTGKYDATVSVERLFTKLIAGSRVEFPPSAAVPGGEGIYFRISTNVTGAGPNNSTTTAETTAVYRFVN